MKTTTAPQKLFAVVCKKGICSDPGGDSTWSSWEQAIFTDKKLADELATELDGPKGLSGCKNGDHTVIEYHRPSGEAICLALNALNSSRIASALELDPHELAEDWIRDLSDVDIKIRWNKDSGEFVV